jgi:hypothetical protein
MTSSVSAAFRAASTRIGTVHQCVSSGDGTTVTVQPAIRPIA